VNTTQLARPKICPLRGGLRVLLTGHGLADTSPPLRHPVVFHGQISMALPIASRNHPRFGALRRFYDFLRHLGRSHRWATRLNLSGFRGARAIVAAQIHTVVAEITPPGATMPVLNTTSRDARKVGSDPDHDLVHARLKRDGWSLEQIDVREQPWLAAEAMAQKLAPLLSEECTFPQFCEPGT